MDCPGLPRLCVKKYKIKGTHHWQEARNLAQVDHIPHLPRLVGVCPYPPAVLMTCHGAMTLQKWIEDLYERRHFLRILYDLTGILDSIHAGGFIHGDIHGDNVVLDFAEDGRAQLTLIDVGCMRPIHGDFGPMRDVLGMGLLTMVARLHHGDSFAMLDECFRGFLDEGKASCAEIRRRILPFLN